MKSYVLIHSCADDPHTDSVMAALAETSTPAIRLNREDCFDGWSIEMIDSIIRIYVRGKELREDDIRAVFWRRDYVVEPNYITLPGADTELLNFLAHQRAIHVNSNFLALAQSVFFLNNPHANRKANSKPLQMQLAQTEGLRVARTYSGSDPSAALGFCHSLWDTGHSVCTKNVETMHFCQNGDVFARYTTRMTPEDAGELDSLRHCPLVFQEYVPKRFEYRVTVVGSDVFACQIDSQAAGNDTAVDWRNYDIPRTPHYAVELPPEIAQALIRLVGSLGLVYGAIDLIENPDGEFYFLEVNSMGQWLWTETLTELPISRAIAIALSNGRAC